MPFWTALRTLEKAPVERRASMKKKKKTHASSWKTQIQTPMRRHELAASEQASSRRICIHINIHTVLPESRRMVVFLFFSGKKKQPRYPAAAGGWLFYLHWERARCSFECWTIGKLQLWFYKEGLSDMKLHHWCQRGIKHIILNITEAQASKKKVWPCSGKPLWRQKSENNSPQYNHQQ